MAETKIGMKIEEETKYLTKMCEKIGDAINHELDKGIEKVNTEELGEAVDMLKDLYEAKEKMVKSCYYKQVMEAMEEHDFEDEEEIMDEGRRGYRGQPRSQSGRFMSRGDGRRSNRGRSSRRGYDDMMMYDDMDWDEMERMRDMDRPIGRMGYSGSGSMGGSQGQSGSGSSSMGSGQSNGGSMSNARGYSESRYDRAKRGYEETKSIHKDNSAESKQMKMKELENYMKELSTDVTEMIMDASPEEKSMLKNKMQVLMQKIN